MVECKLLFTLRLSGDSYEEMFYNNVLQWQDNSSLRDRYF